MKDSFEQWMLTKRGKDALEESILTNPGKNVTYLRNRLWWAYDAGCKSGDIRFSDCGEVMRALHAQYLQRLPKWLRSQITEIVRKQINEQV